MLRVSFGLTETFDLRFTGVFDCDGDKILDFHALNNEQLAEVYDTVEQFAACERAKNLGVTSSFWLDASNCTVRLGYGHDLRRVDIIKALAEYFRIVGSQFSIEYLPSADARRIKVESA